MKIKKPSFETTTLWDFPTQNYGDKPHGDNKYSGVTPAFINRILKSDKYMAWLIGDQAKKKKFTPVGFKLYVILERYFKPVDIICVTRHNQTSNTSIWHRRAKEYNFYLRGFKYLIIMQKTN